MGIYWKVTKIGNPNCDHNYMRGISGSTLICRKCGQKKSAFENRNRR